MADLFRDCIAISINDATYYRYLDIAVDILAMPQMEWLRDWAEQTHAHEDPTCPPELREWITQTQETRRG